MKKPKHKIMDNLKLDNAILEALKLINKNKDSDQKLTYNVFKVVDKQMFTKGVKEVTNISIILEKKL